MPDMRKLLIISIVLVVMGGIAGLTPGPMFATNISGTLQSWDSLQQQGLIKTSERFVFIRLDHTSYLTGQPPEVDCQVQATGRYAPDPVRSHSTLVVAILTVTDCPD
jgi:hypothetical protein